MSKMRSFSIIMALFVIFCSGFYYLLASERLWFESSNYSVRHGGDDAYSSEVYQSINGRIYFYLIEINGNRAIYLIDNKRHKVGYANNYLNRLILFGFTIDAFPISYDISMDSEKTGFDPKLDIQPNVISFYGSSEDNKMNKRITIQFYRAFL